MNRKELFILTLVIFLSIVIWIVFDIHRAKTISTISEKNLRQVVPLTPTFDNDTIRKLKNREE